MKQLTGPIGAGKTRHVLHEVMLRSLSSSTPVMTDDCQRKARRKRRWSAVRSTVEQLYRTNTQDALVKLYELASDPLLFQCQKTGWMVLPRWPIFEQWRICKARARIVVRTARKRWRHA